MKKNMANDRVKEFILAVIMFCVMVTAGLPVYARDTERVRVGYFNFEGYHMIDASGRRSGYGYDYLQYMARYDNFNYEYVGYEKSWSEMQDMLEAGEIDLLTSAQKTKERQERFDFSEEPIGNSASILTVKSGDDRYMTDDYKKLDGIRIGLLEGNSRNESLKSFSEENGFTYQPVYFNGTTELTAALSKGEQIDAILTSSLRKIENEWIVAAFDVKPFYIMVKKGNQKLLNRINEAMERIKADLPDLPSTLYEKYYSARSGDEIAYTAEERAYIKQCRDAGKTIRVSVKTGREPISYTDGEETLGIIPEIARTALQRTGLYYEFVPVTPETDAGELLLDGSAEVCFDSYLDFYDAEIAGLRVTEPYLGMTLSCVTKRSLTGEPETAAILQNSSLVKNYVEKGYDKADITEYGSVEAALKAVLNGTADALYVQTYIAQRLVNEDVRNRLKEQLVPGYDMELAVAVNGEDPLLFSILNKAVGSLDNDEISRITLEQTLYLSGRGSFLGYLYTHPFLWIVILVCVAGFAVILILYLYRRKNLKLEQEKNREFERFISYVCKANDSVEEIDLEKRLRRIYRVEDGKVYSGEEKLASPETCVQGIYPKDREAAAGLFQTEKLEQLVEAGGEEYFECRLKREGQGIVYQWFAFTFQGVPPQGETAGKLMVFMKNVDGVKREEEQKRQVLVDALAAARQAGEAKSVFMSRMSHEIRTPLNAIIGYMTIAKSNLSDHEKLKESLEKSEFAAHHLLSIINDVLDISAIESGRMKIAHEAFHIKQLLTGITSIFYTQAREKGVTFYARLNDLVEENLVGDQLRLNQILMNLLSNAVKFTSAGGMVTLEIAQKNRAEGKVYLQITVSDTGIGMSEDYKKRLFQPFEQQDAATARKFGGTGLGLSITKNLVNIMEGTMDVESEEGKGTTFTVNLAFEAAEDVNGASKDIYDFSDIRVLVLYGEDGDYMYVRTLLERFGVKFDIVLEPEEALRRIEERKEPEQQYDLCMMDWDIQGVDSGELAKQLWAAGTGEKPFLVAMAYEAPDLSSKEIPIGGMVLKPVFQSSMFDVLSNMCKVSWSGAKTGAEDVNSALKGMRVLMAEDNEMNMEIAKEILEAYGLIVDWAANGQEAAEMFERSKEGTYQAILMDIQMPVMNGYEASKKIRACRHPQAEQIPIIALTADAFAEDINRTFAAGMNDHIAKPIDFGQLCRTLSKYTNS